MFLEKGYDGATVSEIVHRAGVAQGPLYLSRPSNQRPSTDSPSAELQRAFSRDDPVVAGPRRMFEADVARGRPPAPAAALR